MRVAGLVVVQATLFGAALAKKKPRNEDWQQVCSATDRECRLPLEFRDPAKWTPAPDDPPGHLRPLGHADFDSAWDGLLPILDDMTPEVFWTEYWPNKPFVLRGAGLGHAAAKTWKDDDYIIKKSVIQPSTESFY
jgi:hypothetical protein